jgi:hypothetical protein
MAGLDEFYGPNAGYALELLERDAGAAGHARGVADDGREAVQCLVRIEELVEEPEALLLDG